MNEKIKEYFKNPRNLEVMPDATVMGKGGDPGCGDYIELYLKIEKDVIIKASAMVAGCPYAIATTSAFTEMITNNNWYVVKLLLKKLIQYRRFSRAASNKYHIRLTISLCDRICH